MRAQELTRGERMNQLIQRLVKLPTQADKPEGDTWLCTVCQARVRANEPHRALEPRPHATLQTCIVVNPVDYKGRPVVDPLPLPAYTGLRRYTAPTEVH
jgi:hypothetical protein